MEKRNGISVLWDTQRYSSDITVYSDASGSWGCRALWQQKWFNLPCSAQLQTCSIAVKELVPVVVTAALYGSQWRGKIVTFRVDNIAVVEVLNSTSCRDSHLMHLVHLLVFLASYHNFWFTASHIQGKQNTLADALSRNNMNFSTPKYHRLHENNPKFPESWSPYWIRICLGYPQLGFSSSTLLLSYTNSINKEDIQSSRAQIPGLLQ